MPGWGRSIYDGRSQLRMRIRPQPPAVIRHCQALRIGVFVLAICLLPAICTGDTGRTRLVRVPIVGGTDLRFSHASLGPRPVRDIRGIQQDDQGFVWLGTINGLLRYDGYQARSFRPRNAGQSEDAELYTTAMFKDRSGTLWIGSDDLVLRYHPATGEFEQYRLHPGDTCGSIGHVDQINQDREGTIWLATSSGLKRIYTATGSIACYRHREDDESSISSDQVKSILESRDGTLWVATTVGLDAFDRGTGKVTRHVSFREPSGSQLKIIASYAAFLFEDHGGIIWIAYAFGDGLASFDPKEDLVTVYAFGARGSDENATSGVYAILEDQDDVLWLGTRKRGLVRFDRDRKRAIRYQHDPNDPNSLSEEDGIESLFEDGKGRIWVGGLGGTLDWFDYRHPSPFRSYRRLPHDPHSLTNGTVLSVYQDSRGDLWVGTLGGLNRIERKTAHVTRYESAGSGSDRLSNTNVVSIAEDRGGYLWFGTEGGGLNRFDPRTGQFKAYLHDSADPHSLSSDIVIGLLIDHRGTLWVETDVDLNRFDPHTGRFTVYTAGVNGVPRYHGILEDSHGAFWLPSYAMGLHRFDPETGQFTIYRSGSGDGRGLSNDRVYAVCVDRSGTVWAATYNGLNRFDPSSQKFTVYYASDGLPSSEVVGILEDNRQDLWLTTSDGLSRFDPRQKTFTNYYVSDGLPGNEFSYYPATSKSLTGEMFFGLIRSGLVAFFPDRVIDDRSIPPIVLTDFDLFGNPVPAGQDPLKQSISLTRSLKLEYWQNIVSFEFAALSYSDPTRNRYRYKLEGLEKEWHETDSTRRLATYTTLPPGEYVFRVQGSNSHGIWNERGASVRLSILPPWWSTWWFRVICVALILGFLWMFYRLRVRAFKRRQALLERHQTEIRALNEQMVKAQEAERVRISGELHDGVLQQITSLTLRLGKVKRQVPTDSEATATVSGLQQQLIKIGTDIRHISHELHPALLQEAGLPAALTAYCEEFSLVRGLPVECETDESVEHLSPGAALCLYRIAQEALGNAAKYSEAKKVEVRLTRADGRVCLSVSDDGIGCTADQIGKSGGLGVINMRERTLQLDGTFEFDSELGRGTTVKVEVPFRADS